MKKGFTLIEILAVVVIIGLIFILVIPKVTNSLKNKKSDVDTTTNNIVLTAAKNYVNSHLNKFDKEEDNIFCLPITTLTKNGYLDNPVKNLTDNKDVTNSKSVKITYNNGFKYELVDKKECSIVVAEKETDEYVDIYGNKYKKLSYIESTGSQYIDTGVTLPFSMEIKAKYTAFDNGYSQSTLFGAQNSSSPYNSTFLRVTKNGTGESNGVKCLNNYIRTNVIVDTNIHKVNLTCFKNNAELFLDDSSKGVLNSTSDVTPYSVYLYATNNGGAADQYSKAIIYYVKFYSDEDSNVLIHDFVPAVDKNYVACMFDKVEKKCYYNKGTGSLKYDYSQVSLIKRNLFDQVMSKKNESNINVYNNGNTHEMYAFTHAVTDQTPALTDYRYIGDEPYNYVRYNDELWRIVGVFNVEDSSGNMEERIKLVKIKNVTGISKWSDSTDDISWENSNVKQFLNTTFYNSIPSDYKDLIETTKFYVAGDVDYYDVGTIYNAERGSKTVNVNGSRTSNNWIGKVGLLYTSDYGYTFAYGVEDNCFNSLGTCGTSQGSDPSKSWMFNGNYAFFMTACTYSKGYIFSMIKNGNVNAYGSSQTIYNLYPTIYLSRNANYIIGDGAYQSPYVINE